MANDTLESPDATPEIGVSSRYAGDAELLQWYFSDRANEAFEALIRRHGPMVLGVCNRVLGDSHAAEDAFQATFLVLAQRTQPIDSPHQLGQWLHGVARRTALAAQRKRNKRTEHEQRAADMRQNCMIPDESHREFREILDEEIEQLPTRFRQPLIMYHLQGITTAEVARQLGAPKGTVEARLVRARELLRGRLSRRGVLLSLALIMLFLEEEAARAALPERLIESTVTAAGSAAPLAALAVAGSKMIWAIPLAIALSLFAGAATGLMWNSATSEAAAAAAVVDTIDETPLVPPDDGDTCLYTEHAAEPADRQSDSDGGSDGALTPDLIDWERIRRSP